ncbi:hypothetical protein [Histidinibacterium aquaticum]|uniref:Dihydroxy-acid dehydratase n=1 Tax=Histidinibacterium aquaticum TaxID=2613962 RepID=A0A5J5GED4_9RHOB|nr:hypothetical protein [Histidinibacterium aquaticum]KAA9006152.1 hypothetical protein F3S47_16545 [Histidinibacterium aquaticum]
MTAMRGVALATAVLAAGCATEQQLQSPPPTSLALYDGALRAVGPTGYCAARGASQPTSGFAVFAPCSRLLGDAADPERDAVLTFQSGEPGSALVTGAVADLVALLEGPEGGALLTVDMPVVVASVETGDDVVFVEYSELGVEVETPPPLWRAFFDIGDRLVTASIRPVEGVDLGTEAERTLVGEAVDAMREAND